MSPITTFAPCATSRRASAAPWPRAPPLTSTTLLSKRAMSAPLDYQPGSLADQMAWFKICWSRLAVLGGLADVERDLIRTRTAEGRSRAKAQGKPMGRPPSLTPAQQREAIRRRAEGATLDELARSYNVSRATISRLQP